MRYDPWRCPQCGEEAKGTLETIPGIARLTDAQQIVSGVQPQDLRDNQNLRQHVATELSRVQSVLDGLLVDRPRRNILRRPK